MGRRFVMPALRSFSEGGIIMPALRSLGEGGICYGKPLRALRFVHFSAWIARRWQDPAFQRAFPHFSSPAYWNEQLSDLRDQLSVISSGEGILHC